MSPNDAVGSWQPPGPSQPDQVRLVLISECAAPDPRDNYGASPDSLFDATTLEAFACAGLVVESLADLARHGIHCTVVLRRPKGEGRISAATITEASGELEAELATFPHAESYLLMGDVAIAAINAIARRRGAGRAIPAGSTYKIRGGEFWLGPVRLFPSYLQAGPAWYIEASKRQMVGEDIAAALRVCGITPQ